MIVYLDNAATTKPYDEVIDHIAEIQRNKYGNPSSAHSMGLEAEKLIRTSGDIIGRTLKASHDNIIFTSGGTESDNMAMIQPFSNVDKIKGKRIIISAVEHPAVNAPSDHLKDNGADLVRIPVDKYGMVDTDQLKASVNEHTTIISIMFVNNEVGTIQPVKDICTIKKEACSNINKRLLIHTDAVQAYGKLQIDVTSSDFAEIDMMSISAHKIHGPKGVGALYVKSPEKVKPFIRGGGQQQGYRSGTENVAGISGFGFAADIQHANLKNNMEKIAGLRKKLLDGLRDNIENIRINSPEEISFTGEPGKCIPSILSVSFPGTRGEVILHSLEQSGIYVSTESACSSKKKGNSPILTAMGLTPEESEGTVRFSISTFNTDDEIGYTIEETKKAVDKFRKLTGNRKQ